MIVLLGGDAGLRAGEMVALHWTDVDFSRKRLAVRHSDWRGKLTSPKNGRVRYVPLTERLSKRFASTVIFADRECCARTMAGR